MRDIRQDLEERLRGVDAELLKYEATVAALQKQRYVLAALLDAELRRWQSLQPGPAVNDEKPQTAEIIAELMATGEEWSTAAIAAIARRRGCEFGNTNPGRSIHFQLVNLARNGAVRRTPSGKWVKATDAFELREETPCEDLSELPP